MKFEKSSNIKKNWKEALKNWIKDTRKERQKNKQKTKQNKMKKCIMIEREKTNEIEKLKGKGERIKQKLWGIFGKNWMNIRRKEDKN